MGGVGINLFNWLSQGCMVLPLIRRYLLTPRQGSKDRRIWNVHFIREFNDWKMNEGLHFLRILGANTPPMDVRDRMRWKLKLNGDFDIRSYYNKLRNSPSILSLERYMESKGP